MEKKLSGRAWDDLPEDKKRVARPWDVLDPNMPKVTDKVRQERIDACMGCENLIKFTKQCKKCGCFMKAKTSFPNSKCPLNKWGPMTDKKK